MKLRLTFAFLFFSMVHLIVRVTAKEKENLQRALVKRLFRGYEKLPPPNGPTVVELGIYVNYFFSISEQSMDYRINFYLRRRWMDSRLRFNVTRNNNKTLLKLEDSQINQIWLPDVFFRNEKGANYHYVTQPNRFLNIYNTGNLWYVSKITATFSCPMKLQKYPLDTQYCPMQLESFGFNTDTVLLRWFDPKHLAVQFDKTGKELPEMVVEDDVILEDCTYNDSLSQKTIPCLQVNFVVNRPIGYSMIQFYIPSILLVMLSWVSFWISVDAVVARVNIGLMTILNLVTQSTGSRNLLPKVSYVKAIDVWMTACLVFAFASLIEFAIVNVWSRVEAQQQKRPKSVKKSLPNSADPSKLPAPSLPSNKDAPTTISSTNQGKVLNRSTNQGSSTNLTNEKPPDGKTTQLVIDVQGQSDTIPRRETASLDVPPSPLKMVRRLSTSMRSAVAKNFSKNEPRAKRLDRLSRKLFPLTFLLFNVVYWMAYAL